MRAPVGHLVRTGRRVVSHEIGQRLLSLVNGGHAALGRADSHLHVQCLIFVRVNLLRGRHRVVIGIRLNNLVIQDIILFPCTDV